MSKDFNKDMRIFKRRVFNKDPPKLFETKSNLQAARAKYDQLH